MALKESERKQNRAEEGKVEDRAVEQKHGRENRDALEREGGKHRRYSGNKSRKSRERRVEGQGEGEGESLLGRWRGVFSFVLLQCARANTNLRGRAAAPDTLSISQ